MTSRERVARACNHQEPDRIPLDLGGSVLTGMHASSVYKLRQALQLDPPGTPIKIIDPYMMLGEIQPDLIETLGVDVVELPSFVTLFGFKKEGWKAWELFDGTPLLVPDGFNTEPEPNGDILMYPEGDRAAPPSGRIPKDGFYFDAIIRQPPILEEELKPEDNMEEFVPISEELLAYYKQEAERLYYETDKAILASFGGASFGDIALVAAPWLKYPKGIREVEEWYMSLVTRRDYVYKVFERQCEVAISNLGKIYQAVGDTVFANIYTGADFGMQNGLFISPRVYRALFRPFHREMNNWIHQHTSWKTCIHSCGSVIDLIPDFIEAGFDILNPVQTTAAGMEAKVLQERFGDQITFWGGGIDTQHTLPFGTPDDVRKEVLERMRVFGKGGGFIFNPVHNVQANTPVENLLAMYETFQEHRAYPLE